MKRRPEKKKHRFSLVKCIWLAIFLTLLLSVVTISITMYFAPTESSPENPYARVKGDYVLMLLQCVVGVLAMLLPSFLQKKWQLVIPSRMMILFALFLYSAIYLGEVRDFYYNVPHWDTILHTCSGAMLGALGFSVIHFLNKDERVPMHLSPAFIAFFTLCFAVFLGAVWEIYEFTADSILHTNMQKFALEDGTLLMGHNALKDTMKDIIVDTIGALVMSIIGYISIKYKKGWVEKLLLHRKKEIPSTKGSV